MQEAAQAQGSVRSSTARLRAAPAQSTPTASRAAPPERGDPRASGCASIAFCLAFLALRT